MELLLDDDLDIDLDRLALPGVGQVVDDAPQEPARDSASNDQASIGPMPEDVAWFEAASPFGPLSLCVQHGGTVRHATAAAVALQQAGAVLDALDDWTALDLDWRWTALPQAADAGSHMVLRWPADEAVPVCAHLVLPWLLVRRLPAPTGALVEAVRWEPAQATVVVAQLALSSDEFDALEPGGAVVLPGSMRADWRGVLRAAGEPADAGVPLLLAPPQAPQVVPREPAAGPLAGEGGAIVCEVRLDTTPRVAIERLAGWTPGELGDLGAQACLWQGEGTSARRCASGTLMPWGGGWALALEAVQPG
ncbi:MAG TPA: hypothetical protein VFZ28_04200 [Burkholderiaceae bacterium]|nr:hypothetical protein [Burkholderiaceae bacterium]